MNDISVFPPKIVINQQQIFVWSVPYAQSNNFFHELTKETEEIDFSKWRE